MALLLLRIGLGVLFVYAGVMKILNPAGFLIDVQHYRLLPYIPAVAFSLYLPWLEIFSGACVILKKYYPGALAILLGLMILFTGALISAWARGLDVSCGCFGTESGTANYPWGVTRDLLIIFAIVLVGRMEQPPRMAVPAN